MVERKGKSRGLGRGLSSLMGDINNDPISSSVNSENQTLEKLVPCLLYTSDAATKVRV